MENDKPSLGIWFWLSVGIAMASMYRGDFVWSLLGMVSCAIQHYAIVKAGEQQETK